LKEGDLAERAARGDLAFGTVDSWLIWKLTGGRTHVTDFTNASRTMLFDIGARAWSKELCALFGVPASLLPEVRASAGDFGLADGAMLGATGTIPIRGVAGDQQAALFGQGCWRPGEGKNTYGTGAFLLLNTGAKRPSSQGLLATLACDAIGAREGIDALGIERRDFPPGAPGSRETRTDEATRRRGEGRADEGRRGAFACSEKGGHDTQAVEARLT